MDIAPAVSGKGVDVFVLGEMDGLQEGLGQVGDGAGGSGFYVAADDGGEEASRAWRVAGGEVVAGEEIGEVFAESILRRGRGLLLGVVEAEIGMVAGARGGERGGRRGHPRT